MAGNARTTAGTVIEVTESLPATNDQAGWEALLDFSPIGEVTSIGDFGRTYETTEHKPLATRRTERLKTFYDDGQPDVEMALYEDDAGQVKLNALLPLDSPGGIKITDQAGNVDYYKARVNSFVKGFSAGAVQMATTQLDIADDPVFVAAA